MTKWMQYPNQILKDLQPEAVKLVLPVAECSQDKKIQGAVEVLERLNTMNTCLPTNEKYNWVTRPTILACWIPCDDNVLAYANALAACLQRHLIFTKLSEDHIVIAYDPSYRYLQTNPMVYVEYREDDTRGKHIYAAVRVWLTPDWADKSELAYLYRPANEGAPKFGNRCYIALTLEAKQRGEVFGNGK